MRLFKRKLRPWAAVLFASAFLVACGDDDDDPSSPDGFGEESAQEMEEVAEELVAPAEVSSEVQANLFNAYVSLLGLGGAPGVSPVAPFELTARTRAPFRPAPTLPSVAAAPMGALIPEEVEGTTFVWDTGDSMYVASDLTGAPANGVRFIWYEVNFDGIPVTPLTPLGHADLMDESTAEVARLEVLVVRDEGDETLADYFVQGEVDTTATSATVTLRSEGFFSDGTTDLDFITQVVIFSSDTEERLETSVDLEGADGTITLELEEAFSDAGASADGTFTIAGGGNEASFEFAGEGEEQVESIEGSMSFNGEEVVVFSGEADDPEFTQPDGSALTEELAEALAGMWVAFGATFLFAFEMLIPFYILMIFAGF